MNSSSLRCHCALPGVLGRRVSQLRFFSLLSPLGRGEATTAEKTEKCLMQFGLFTLFDFFPDRQNEVVYYQDTLDFVIHAEKLGFDSVWMGEEHFYSF